MPRIIKTMGDRGHDAEIDRLWSELDALRKAPTAAVGASAVAVTTVVVQQAPTVVTASFWRLVVGS